MTLDDVLPLRWTSDAGLPELTGYLRRLAGRASVIVVDGGYDGVVLLGVCVTDGESGGRRP
ncbi:hypothetical protein ITJ64_17790 [Herbiconiux sp. VKM Ac-1786]|uniref:hypothetical protein n=1 Tax=Herbiconiux sp. VKM Ac-1786 TaxID=2783824 RepID=UPI00188A8029|nr:hypothetical protein [Herbiconiux sp. VKM Ac-1786]MBF4574367.1 hypothetical protein [Herbiconiux sp. VKM Ac-1786]